MPTIKQVESVLDEMVQDPNNPKNDVILNKMGLPKSAIGAWGASKQDPDNPKSIAVKNKVFDRITETLPVSDETGGVKALDRAIVKNLIDRDPILQQKYLEQKGYKIKHSEQGMLVRRPDEVQWHQLDPEGFDRWDVMDIVVDVGQALAEGAATVGGAVLGSVAGPVGAIGGGMAAAGATGAAFETGKQAIAKGLGLREELDVSRIGQEGVIGGMSALAGPVAGKALKGAGRFISKTAPKMVDEAADIIAAGKRLGIKPALRQKFDNDTIRLLEENLTKRLGTLPGAMIRRTARATQKQLDDIAESMIGSAKNLDLVDVGDNAKNSIQKITKERLAPVEELYGKLQGYLKGVDDVVDTDFIAKRMDELADDFTFDPNAQGAINFFKKKIPEISSLDDLKKFRTSIGSAISEAKAKKDFSSVRLLSDLYDTATKARSKSFEKMINELPLKQADLAEAAQQALSQADRQYAEIASGVKDALIQRGRSTAQSVKSIVNGLEDVTEMKLAKRLLDTNDPKQLRKFQKVFPEAFDILREGKIAEISKAATNNKKNQLRIGTIMDRIEKMPRASKELIFGEDAIQKVKDLQTLFRSLPPPLNPSGTSHNLMNPTGWGKVLISNFSALGDRVRLSILTNQNALGEFLQNAAETIGDSGATAIAQGIIRGQMPTRAEHEFERSFGVPNVFETPRPMNFGIPNQ